MLKEERIKEIISQITAFTRTTFIKSMFLPELMKLQRELVELTFNADHAENGFLKLWDVEKHLQKLNEERGYVANAELSKFLQANKVVRNTISSEISGNAGEQKVFKELEKLSCQNKVLRNVELEYDGKRTEIDAIVFTNQAIFIIEIKNSKKNIYIDECGEFYRTGYSMHYDCNIANKMAEREEMLRKALEKVGLDYLKIFNIVTFTNPRIDVENKYHFIKVCGSNYLPTFIEKFRSNQWYTYEDMCTMMEAVMEVRCPEAYQMTIDMNDYKRTFAELMAKLEAAEETTDETEAPEKMNVESDNDDVITETSENPKEEHEYVKTIIISLASALTLTNIAVLVGRKLLEKRGEK